MTRKHPPHSAFETVTPDTVAECWEDVDADLSRALWACTKKYDNAHRANIEDIGPHDVIGINCVAQFWDDFSEDQQRQLNELAREQDKAFAEFWAKVTE